MQNDMLQNLLMPTHGERISLATDPLRVFLHTKEIQGSTSKLPKAKRRALTEHVAQHEALFVRGGVDFSRLNIQSLLHHQQLGGKIEFETLGPYLSSYQAHGGVMTQDNLIPEDAIGLQLAIVFRQLFPTARLVSLYDDYNADIPDANIKCSDLSIGHFTNSLRHAFKESLLELYKASGVLSEDAIETIDYLMVSESSKVNDAEALVSWLDAKGHIYRKGEEIVFVNTLAENPLYHRVSLRSSKGKWLCEALDAATFLGAENLQISHIVVLPDYMKDQQDKVWEILRVLGVSPYRYHNIFYSSTFTPASVARTVTDEFAGYMPTTLELSPQALKK